VGINILIADDLQFIKLVLRDLVEKAGFRVVGEASNGEEAIELFQDRRPDVVLMDITMPKMDGLTALKKILKIDPSAKIIMCSALGQQTLIVQALQMGAKDFIVKPFRAERVVNSMKFLSILLLAAVPVTVWPQDHVPVDDREYWTVGVAAFEGRTLSQENLYLTQSFPLMIRERLEAIPTHFFSDSEAKAYRRGIIRREQRRLAEIISADRRARDELFFTPGKREDKAAIYEDRIAANLLALSALRELNPEAIAFPESKPLRFASGTTGQLIFDQPVRSPLQSTRQEDLDSLLWGRFEEIQGYIYVEVNFFDAALGEDVFSYSNAVLPAELYEISDELTGELASILWGRDWASLRVETEPPGASVWLDESFQGRTPGYQSVVRLVDLPPYTEALQQIALPLEPGDFFEVDSEPTGAAVYAGSNWLGNTPLSVEKPDDLNRFLLRKEGYLDFPLYTGSGVEEKVTIPLISDDIDPLEIQNQRRDELYRAFGFFAISIPIPLFFWGFASDYAVGYSLAINDLNFDESERFRAAGLVFYYGYYGTLAVSTSLFINMMVRLVRYLRASDRKA
jgi:two-component system chemotaxis response regulator CheY